MTTQLVKKFGGKRKGYKGALSALASKYPKTAGALGTATTWGGIDLLMSIINALPTGKHGGRVTKRGIGRAKRGLGKVMGKK